MLDSTAAISLTAVVVAIIVGLAVPGVVVVVNMRREIDILKTEFALMKPIQDDIKSLRDLIFEIRESIARIEGKH